MNETVRHAVLASLLLCLGAGPCVADQGGYADPGGLFALRPPQGWQTGRSPIEGGGWFTIFRKGSASVWIVTYGSAEDLNPSLLETVGGTLLAGAVQEIRQHGTVLSVSTKKDSTDIAGASGSALRCDLEFTSRETGDTHLRGVMLAMLGRRVAVLAGRSAPVTDAAGSQSGESTLATLAIESRVPGQGRLVARSQTASGETKAPARDLSSLAGKFKGDAHRERRDKVLVAGDPPLTYGSVASFAELVGECFDVQLNEAEFDATRERFIEYYRKQDAAGKAILAEGWTQLLQKIRATEGPERAASVAEVRKMMADSFLAGSRAGIGWAITMEEAISKRSQSIATASGTKPAFANEKRFKSDFSQADLEAALEMFGFMWIASGRNASLVTAEAVASIRTNLVVGYATFPPDLQYVLANAQQIYAGLRAQWERANGVQRLQMAQAFGQQLDALGLTVPSPRRGNRGSAWSDWEGKSHAQFAGEMVVGLAGSSYKSAW
jgi:hypothetical protein